MKDSCQKLEDNNQLRDGDVVLLGHTHLAIYGLEFQTAGGKNVTMYNTGVGFKGGHFAPLVIHTDQSGQVATYTDGKLKIRNFDPLRIIANPNQTSR
jgi:hypothetical protein